MQALLFAGAAGERPRACGRRSVLRAVGGCCSGCCCSCASMPCWLSPSVTGALMLGLCNGQRPPALLSTGVGGHRRIGWSVPARTDAAVRGSTDHFPHETADLAGRGPRRGRRRGTRRYRVAGAAHDAKRRGDPMGAESRSSVRSWVLAVYALVFRHQAGKLAVHDADALRTFTNFYVTVPALLAALHRTGACCAPVVLARSRSHSDARRLQLLLLLQGPDRP